MASLFAITNSAIMAQSSEILAKAERLFEQEDYYHSLPLFEELLYKGEDQINSNLKAGMCLLFLSKPEKGLQHIKAARNPQNEVNPNYQFWLGRAFHLNMKIDSALMCYRKYLSVSGPNDEFRRGVEDLIAQIHRTEIHFFTGDKSPYEIANLGDAINSPYTEHSPLISSDGKTLVFTSRRPLFANEMPEADGQYSSKLYYSIKNAEGKWSKALPLHPRSGSKGQFSSVQWISSDKLLLLSAEHGGVLYETELDGSEFKDPVVARNMPPAKYFHPDGFICKGMDKFVFAANTLFDGSYDLFFCEKKTESKWTKPWKLSKMINTGDDEIAPYWLDDGKTLIFSSRGLKGLGGYDLYKTKYDQETRSFSEPENLGYPINTPGNETHISQWKGGKEIFISSARANSLGGMDIYRITINDEVLSRKSTADDEGW